MQKIKKALSIVGLIMIFFLIGLFIALKFSTFAPNHKESIEHVCNAQAPALKSGQSLKIMSWNVQYMASKNYVFYYDTLTNDGPDERPSTKHIAWTIKEVARVIKAEDPDVILLQEVDDGAGRTDHEDQAKRLIEALGEKKYACRGESFYWKASFVPHPRIMGSVGMKLVTLSKYKIKKQGQRVSLPMQGKGWLTDHFYLKRALAYHTLPIEGQTQPLVVINTHLSAFAQNTDTMTRQIKAIDVALGKLEKDKKPFVIGGDFNLLANDEAFARLGPRERKYFNPKTEISPLYKKYKGLPTLAQVAGPDYKKYITHFPNDKRIKFADRTIDYFFVPEKMNVKDFRVRQKDTWQISDHLPLMLTIEVP